MRGELTKYEIKIFEKLRKEKMPDFALEERIIRQLIEENLIQNRTYTMNDYKKWAVSVAAMVLIFFVGSYFGKRSADQLTIDPTKGYMLLLHEDTNFAPGDPNVMYNEYADWMQKTYENGMKIIGQELKNTSVKITDKKNLKYDDENEDFRTTGYFIFEASSLEDALEVAKNNPHVKYGGTVEVKEYMVR